MEEIKLKNGATETRVMVIATLISINSLLEEHLMAFYDLVMRCRDSNYKFLGNNLKILEDLSLVQLPSETGSSGHIRNSIRNIVLSAVEGEGLRLKIVSPYPGE